MPVFISHLLFSLIFVYPFILFHIWVDGVGYFFHVLKFKVPFVIESVVLAVSFGLYFILLPVVFDII